MEINNALIDYLAGLSRLRFDESEKEAIKGNLKDMLAFVEKINEVDTEGVEPLIHLTNQLNDFRQDEVVVLNNRDEALKNASNNDGVYIKVPKINTK